MWSMLLVGVLFGAAAVYNVFGPEPDATEATATALIAATLIGLFFATRYHKKKARDFQAWLAQNIGAVKSGGALYEGEILVTPATVITRYQLAVSFLIISYKIPTRIYIVDGHPTGLVAGICTTLTLLLGWWGIPWGPVFTAQVISRNIRGGLKNTVGEILAPAPAAASTGPKASTGA